MRLSLIITFAFTLIATFAQAGISGTGGLSVKPGYVTEKICDGEYGECRMVTYKMLTPEEMNEDKEPFCFNYPRRPEEPCMMFYDYPSSGF